MKDREGFTPTPKILERIIFGVSSAKAERGFTLIELLLSIAIIAILASFTLGATDKAKAKSRDSQAIREMKEMQTALNIFVNDRGFYPNETNLTPYTDNFNDMAQELVQAGFLSEIPVAPAGRTYEYYNYGPGEVGALLITTLEAYPLSTGYSGTCRPFNPGGAPWRTTAS